MVKKNFLKSGLIVLAVLAIALIPMASVNAAIDKDDDPALAYSAHVQNVGWTLASKASTIESEFVKSLAGSEGKSQRLEALKITFTAPAGVTLSCNTHVQGIGWTGWTKLEGKDVLVGTEGQSKRLEAIKFSVTGLEGFEIKYRAHVQGYGWMDWVTANNSTDVTSNFAGTKGESKRIEAIEVLVLKTADAKIFDAHQEAIKAVKEFVANRGTYTFNAKKMEERLNVWIGSINAKTTIGAINNDVVIAERELTGILTDEEIYVQAETVKDAIDNYIETRGLNGPIQGKTENGTYAEVASIKAAIADAKANVLVTETPKEEYTTDDFKITLRKDCLFKAATEKINLAVAEYGLEKVNELYANEVTGLTEKVLSLGKYNEHLNALQVKDEKIDKENVPALANVVKLIDGLEPDATLKDVISNQKVLLDNFVTANYASKNFGGEFKNIQAVMSSDTGNTLSTVPYIKDAIETGKAMIDEARSTKAVVEAYDSAKAVTVTALREFINHTISVLTTMGNDSGKLLNATAAATMKDAMNIEYETVDAEALALAEAFHTMLNVANVK